MPHVIIEYSANTASIANIEEITRVAHEVMIQSGLFSTADIKTRAYGAENFLVGEKGQEGSFVHVAIFLLEGRTTSQKQNLSAAMRNTLQTLLKDVDQLSIDVRELQKDTYRKYVHS